MRTTLAAAGVVAGIGGVLGSPSGKCCWCDPDTAQADYSIVGSDGQTYNLVFSDEFSDASRKFANGQDPKWTALNIGDTSNKGAAFYLPEQTYIAKDGETSALIIKTENASHIGDSPTGEKNIFMPYKSAMLQSWDKFCFTGGIVEFRAKQPRGEGYWPALWLFGNLGRAVYQNSNTGLWPWSYDECDADLKLPATDPPQRISACMDQDSSSGLHPFQGRGATELDILEGAVTNTGLHSYVVGSLQLSPGLPAYFKPPLFDYPLPAEGKAGSGAWYNDLKFGPDGYVNNGWYGPPWGSDCPTGCPDALSGGMIELDTLDLEYWTYRMEWKTGPNGHLSWIYNGEFVWGMSASSFGAYEVCSDRGGVKECQRTPPRQVPAEPMSLVMNTAIGTWNGGKSALDGKHWPAMFYVDYVRVWQAETNVGCNPPDYPTKTYIQNHAEWYGEPANPSGYDTCPEVYPQSAYDNAERIKARGKKMQTTLAQAKAAGRQPHAATAAIETFAAFPHPETVAMPGSADTAKAAPAAPATSYSLLAAVATLSATVAAAAAVGVMKFSQQARTHDFSPAEETYTEYQLAK